MKNARHKKILNVLLENEKVTIDELADLFEVSTMTIRRDLDTLQDNGFLTRYYGGAKVNKVVLQELSFKIKSEENIDVKRKIAQYAFSIIDAKSSIYLDAGTTTYELAKLLAGASGHTIITCDLQIASLLANSNNDIYCVGGLVETATKSLSGTYALDLLKRINIDICFLSTNSISNNLEIETSSESKGFVKEYLLSLDINSVLLVDSSKFIKKSLFKIAPLGSFDYIISDYQFNKEEVKLLKNSEIININ
ncbi:MAG: DeoR/GlpR family DNA-binding transcription regulator [Erysipelotrichales bacterium]